MSRQVLKDSFVQTVGLHMSYVLILVIGIALRDLSVVLLAFGMAGFALLIMLLPVGED